MSQVIYDMTRQNIESAYQNHNEPLIEKETDYILSKIITVMLRIFSDKLKGITFSKNDIQFDIVQLRSEKHHSNLLKWITRISVLDSPSSDLEFGKLKLELESWYYQLGGESIKFEYQENYLLTPKETAAQLGVSRVTLNKYIQQGFECVETTSHRKIPKFMVDIWQDPVYAIRLQMFAQEKKLKNQTPAMRLQEINTELTEFQVKYKSISYQDAFQGFDGDSMDDPSDYYAWRDLEEERRKKRSY